MHRCTAIIVGIMLCSSGLDAARFLFDYTKNETAGNADWIIDSDYPYPQPPNPTSPTDWDRAISSWGYALYRLGHEVVTLPPDSAITYGTSSPLDLSNFDVFVMVEPQNPLSSAEVQAIVDFVYNGGGFLMIADHNASDRDNDGWDSPRVFNAAFENIFGVHFNITGEPNNSISDSFTNVNTDPTDPIIHGPIGDVDTFGYWQGDVAVLKTDINPSLQGHIWKDGEPLGSTQNVIVFTGTYGNGRIGGFGDSSPVDDGTGDPGDNLYDGWYTYQDSTLTLNLCLWLAEVEAQQNNPPVISNLRHIPSLPTDTDSVVVRATITDDHGLLTDSMYFSVNSSSYTPSYHFLQEGDTFYFNIGRYPQGTAISYYVVAKDDSGAVTYSDTLSYTVSAPGGEVNAGIVINEIMYNPDASWGDDSCLEYVEVWNATTDTVDMSGWYLMDNTPEKVAHVPAGTKVPPNYFVVFARNVDSLLSKAEYQTYLTDGDEILINIGDSVQLSNSGEWVKLVDNSDSTVDIVSYDDASPWPTEPDGGGPSLELISPYYDNTLAESWAASEAPYGTPGAVNSVALSIGESMVYSEGKSSRRILILSVKDFEGMDKDGYEIFGPDGRRVNTALESGLYFLVNRKEGKFLRIIVVK
ncbi:MAG: lamin tail domain-containing protein [bacterium]|nr:lamin tail domain-containing protein [bacterium]